MNLFLKYLVFVSLISNISTQEIFENSTNLCQRCTCIKGPQFLLDCRNKGFHNIIAEWPQHDTTLIATFSYNNIPNLEVLPDSDKVTDLIFSNCGIKSLDNGVFKAVKNVQFVDLSYNLLTTEEIAPEKFKGPYNKSVYAPLDITHMNLAYNQIHSLPHNVFEHLNNLRQLNLEGNQLKVLDPPTQVALSGLKNLETLNLANNKLTDLAANAVKNLQNLKEINLSSNLLDAVPGTLSLLGPSLEFVYLDNNPIFELTDESFLGVQGIVELSLTNLTRLNFVNANTFAPLKKLKILNLSNNMNLYEVQREAFGPNQTLEELYLQSSALTYLDCKLTNWSTLKVLNISDNDFTCNCNLYHIAQNLNPDIIRDKNGPICTSPINDRSVNIYQLTDDICDYKASKAQFLHVIKKHFRIIKIILLFCLSSLALATLFTGTLVFLKYRKLKLNRNYAFTTQIHYNPLRNSNA